MYFLWVSFPHTGAHTTGDRLRPGCLGALAPCATAGRLAAVLALLSMADHLTAARPTRMSILEYVQH